MIQDVDAVDWRAVHNKLYDDGFNRLEYLTAAHNEQNNFEVFSKLSKSDLSETLLARTLVTDFIESIIEIYPTAKFHEQETHQLFGLEFIGHENISRAFETDFAGFPLRRDYALINRQKTIWPGAVELDEKARRRPSLPPGVHESWNQ